ncbi:helicase C-terminal domain-containing protein [Mycotypha africana]|uniref:helicase C-terminal domain-containing protein n=1 Tax=Mycotypha africana TaxID=64632 RepID=UPI002301EBE0|nr:helicase C-terminal domain-containing protein [Mycotypha africana]KAI8987718.1 helicase C-terminal domain-containing protein [Mycotypha africana]
MNSENFGFPFEPYNIQYDFMKELYETLSAGKIGIFESPTGTGKSLSLICGSLKWLKDDDEKQSQPTKTTITSKAEQPSWIAALKGQTEEVIAQEELRKQKSDLKERVERARLLKRNKDLYYVTIHKDSKKRRNVKTENAIIDEFLLDDYDSDQEDTSSSGSRKPKAEVDSNLSKEVQALLAKLETKSKPTVAYDKDENNDENIELENETKIFYASRTHSQLSQFVHEVRKTVYASDVFEVSLASRNHLCINEEVRQLGNVQKINEACLDLQKKASKKGPCPYLLAVDNTSKWNEFRDHALAEVGDIEDLAAVGERLQICPYYGTRHTVKTARLIVLPYQNLLHANTRESLGISLKNNVVILDEAHNLMETITSLHTVQLSLSQITLAGNQLKLYVEKYRARLAGKNVVYIRQILLIIRALVNHLSPKDVMQRKDSVLRVNDFLHALSIDHINMFKIQRYLEVSSLSRKLNGFLDMAREKEEEERQKQLLKDPKADLTPPTEVLKTSTLTLTQIEAFLMTLTNSDKDGRIVTTFGDAESSIPAVKYMLLNPADAFSPIVEEARSVILAGGTMEPITDFMNYLFPSVPKDRITHFSCGHIIPPTNLLTVSLEHGPTGKPLLFNFESRQDVKLIDEAGLSIANLCNIIPDGVVCFFPSFTFLEQAYKRWLSVESGNILSRVKQKKKVFIEPRESKKVDSTLRDYTLQIESTDNNLGALLLCVVNGKMSEGINFSDRLGRGVIMVGLPFANRGSVELIEKIKFAQQSTKDENINAGKEYYENLCMRGVNQSIGRAIRHRGDYATIILLDKRYSTMRIQKKLPKWIGSHIEHSDKFGKVMNKVSTFFRGKRNM